MFFKYLCVLVLWTKVASALERLTLPMFKGYFHPKHNDTKICANHLNPVMLVFIGYSSCRLLSDEPMCQGFSHFSAFLHTFVFEKLATSSIRVKLPVMPRQTHNNALKYSGNVLTYRMRSSLHADRSGSSSIMLE